MASAFHLDSIIGNINSLVRTATPERFAVPDDAPKIPMRLIRMELAITDVAGK
jgi:hypothetical protein